MLLPLSDYGVFLYSHTALHVYIIFSIVAKVLSLNFCCKRFDSECHGRNQQGTAKFYSLNFSFEDDLAVLQASENRRPQ